MIDIRAASRYANAVLNLARQDGLLDAVDKDLAAVRALLEKHPEITHLVLNSTITQAEKEDFLGKIFGTSIAPLTLRFMKLLVKKNRFQEFEGIQEVFHRLFEKERGVQQVTAISARPLSAEAQKKLQDLLARKLGTKVSIIWQTDASMIGGLVLRLGDREINASFRNRLADIRQQLMLQH